MNDYQQPVEFKITALRECPVGNPICGEPQFCVDYWRAHIQTDVRFDADVETLVLLTLNTRKRCTGHVVISTGTLDTLLIHPRQIFKPAIALNAAGIVLMHNHPSGDPSPSEADIKVTRDLIRAGQLLKIEVIDHLVMGVAGVNGDKGYASLRELGHFYL